MRFENASETPAKINEKTSKEFIENVRATFKESATKLAKRQLEEGVPIDRIKFVVKEGDPEYDEFTGAEAAFNHVFRNFDENRRLFSEVENELGIYEERWGKPFEEGKS